MKTRIKLIKEFFWMLLMSALLFCCGKAEAQVLPEYSAFPTSSLGLQLGVQGLGLQGSYSFAKSFNIRLGFDVTPDVTFIYNSRNLRVDRSAVYALVDWQPMYGNTQWFATKWFVTTGFGYYFNNTLYRQGIGATPDYSVSMSKYRPYIGTGLGNLYLFDNIRLRLDVGSFLPTSAPTSSYENKANTITNGLKGIMPGLNTAVTFYIKF